MVLNTIAYMIEDTKFMPTYTLPMLVFTIYPFILSQVYIWLEDLPDNGPCGYGFGFELGTTLWVTIEHIANTLPASHILCAKFCTNGKKKRKKEYHFTHSLIFGGEKFAKFRKRRRNVYVFATFLLGFQRERESAGGVGIHFLYQLLNILDRLQKPVTI